MLFRQVLALLARAPEKGPSGTCSRLRWWFGGEGPLGTATNGSETITKDDL